MGPTRSGEVRGPVAMALKLRLPAGLCRPRLAGPDGGAGAEVVEHALRTAGRPGDAYPPPVEDQTQAEPGPLLRRHHARDLGLDLDRVAAAGQAQQVAEPDDVGIDGEAGQVEGHTQDHV